MCLKKEANQITKLILVVNLQFETSFHLVKSINGTDFPGAVI